MLDPAKPRRISTPIAVSLEDLIPRDNFYRHLEDKLGLSFVRDWTRELYAGRGRPSIDPVIFSKLQLVMFFEGIRSERKLIEAAILHLAHRWYLGYALDESLPDHSSLTRIRQRLGIDTFQRFFEKIVDLCQEAGLVWGRELYFDATKVEANADLDSLVPRFYHAAKTHVAVLFADDTPAAAAETEEAVEDSLPAGVRRLPREPSATGPPAIDDPPWRLLEKRRLDPQRPSSGSYMRTTDFRVSLTDPDTTPMRTTQGTTLGYHDHYVVNGGKRRIILAALVTSADVMENVPMQDLLWLVCFRRKVRPRQVTGDTIYGTVENIVSVEDAGIRAYVPLPDWGSRRPGSSRRLTSPMTGSGTRITARSTIPSSARPPSIARRSLSIAAIPPPATYAPLRLVAPRATTDGSCTGPSTPITWRRYAATMRPRPTRKRCGNGRCGSSPCLRKRRRGTACAGSACGAS